MTDTKGQINASVLTNGSNKHTASHSLTLLTVD